MEWNVSLILFILLIVTLFLLYKANKKKKELEKEQSNQFLNYYNQHINEIEEKFSQRKDELFREYEDKRREYQEKLDSVDTLIKTKEELLESEQDKISRVLSEQKKAIDSELKRYKDLSLVQIQQAVEKEKKKTEDDFNAWKTTFELNEQILKKERNEILEELEDFRKRRASINEAILREKEIKEKEDFYRVILTENDLSDMRILEGIAPQMKNRDIIPKLIWDTILRRPVQEMIKRVTGGKDISGIYKITYIKTGEAYIGKTTDIKTRWQNHCKTAIGLEAAASSTFHTRLALDGIENYTWEIIEEVSKDKLGEREKYWIDFYETKNQLNMKAGG